LSKARRSRRGAPEPHRQRGSPVGRCGAFTITRRAPLPYRRRSAVRNAATPPRPRLAPVYPAEGRAGQLRPTRPASCAAARTCATNSFGARSPLLRPSLGWNSWSSSIVPVKLSRSAAYGRRTAPRRADGTASNTCAGLESSDRALGAAPSSILRSGLHICKRLLLHVCSPPLRAPRRSSGKTRRGYRGMAQKIGILNKARCSFWSIHIEPQRNSGVGEEAAVNTGCHRTPFAAGQKRWRKPVFCRPSASESGARGARSAKG